MSVPEVLKRVFHWGPIIALSIINYITFSTIHVTSMWLPIFSSWNATMCHLIFMFLVGSTLYYFFCSMFIGPGYVPYGWKPEDIQDSRCLQYCSLCEGYKPPRAHHCRKCQRCVMKMDHHCPWINNCCGHKNHAKFTLFLLSAVCGCLQTSVLLLLGIYQAINLNPYHKYFLYAGRENVVFLSMYELGFAVFSFGLALGVVIAVGGLFLIQMKQIIKNETCIENWIVTKAKGRPRKKSPPFIYPYNLGVQKNIQQVFWGPLGNGTTDWPYVEGCNPHTLTVEQLEQKKLKKARKKQYTIVEYYNGSWFPLSKGLRTCLSPPCSDEARISLSVGDTIHVTRWRKRWLYGEKYTSSEIPGDKGWFPRCCALEFTCTESKIKKLPKKNS